MKKQIRRITFTVLILIIIAIMEIIVYYKFSEIETKETKIKVEQCLITTKWFNNRKVYIIEPKGANVERTILYFHGGSYVVPATEDHWKFLQKISVDTKSTIIMPDYPLAPKYNYKNVYDMVEPFYEEVIKQIDTSNFVLMGDSAGGGLALGLAEKISNENPKILPSKIILISPWLDVRLQNEDIEKVQKNDKKLNKNLLQLAGKLYAGKDGINSYLVNPIEGNFENLNNITIFTGTCDILNPDVHKLCEKVNNIDKKIEIKEYQGADHIWFIENTGSSELIEEGYNDLVQLLNIKDKN